MIPERFVPVTFALLRLVFGCLFAFHGAQKVFGMFGGVGGAAVPLASQVGAAGLIELICGTLIMLGLFTRPVAFIACGEMAVAYFTAHQIAGGFPIQNGGELAALYCFAFLYIASHGAGPFSIDGKVRSPRR